MTASSCALPIQEAGSSTGKINNTPSSSSQLRNVSKLKRLTSNFNVKINEGKDSTHEVLSFADQNPGYDYEIPTSPDSTFNLADTADDSLQSFFSRPIKTRSYGWGTGTTLYEQFNPWMDFWENPRVINRILNYNLLRCKLCVKFVLNGNGFHYGRAIASYNPLHTFDTLTKDRTFFVEDVVGASQRPHIYLDPTNSQGGTMCLPFVLRENAIDIPDVTWREMGDMHIHGMQDLKHANGADDSVTVSVFVWAEDVVMSVPTANQPVTVFPQAGEYTPQGDEYGQGIVSKPASFVARAAGALASAPGIGMYARATQLGASAISSIASSFGYSRPNDVAAILSYKPTYAGNMANTNVPDTCTKLTLDAKQELSCDTRTFGLDGTDEMTYKSIATRESYLTQFPWAVDSTSEQLLWNTEVNPVVWTQVSINGKVEYHMPACCFAALPFRVWRGTMKYRFQVVASAFHKGRLKITYDPSYPKTNEYNTNYTRVIDLASERDFTVEIGWGQQTPFLEHRPMLDGGGEIFSTDPISFDGRTFCNGHLQVYVVNELTVPNSTADNDIAINVFVSAGDDFEVADPDERYISDLTWYNPQAGEYTPQADVGNVPDADATTEENAPIRETVDEVMAPTTISVSDHTHDVFFADPVTSIRQILKRYNYSKTYAPFNLDSAVLYKATLNNLPQSRGFAPGAVDIATQPVGGSQAPYNFSKMTHLNYYMPAYVCWRGGIKWKYVTFSGGAGSSWAMVHREAQAVSSYQESTAPQPDSTLSRSGTAKAYTDSFPSNHEGAHVIVPTQNPVLEVELPFYQLYRFGYGKQGNLNLGLNDRSYFHTLWAYFDNFNSKKNGIHAYVAAGEDFTLGFFTGAPVAYYQSSPAL